MPNFRIPFAWLRRRARELRTRLKPMNIEKWEEYGGKVLSREPLILSYGEFIYVIKRAYIEVRITPETWGEVLYPEAYLTYRIATLLGTMKVIDVASFFKKVSHKEWVNSKLVTKRGTSTFTILVPYEEVVYPPQIPILTFAYWNPRRFTKARFAREVAERYGYDVKLTSDLIDYKLGMDLLEEVDIQVYPKRWWYLLAVKVVSEREGELSATAIERELMIRFGLTGRQAFDSRVSALDRGLVRIGVRWRYFTTPKGRDELKKLPKPRIERRIVLTLKGREEIGL